MLPKDSAARKVAEAEATAKLQQGRVDEHFEPIKPGDKPVPYSDRTFRELAIQWLVQTDQVRENNMYTYYSTANISQCQPIQVFEHPAFQKMVQNAARATREVNIPNRQHTRREIISIFQEQMRSLKERLNVRDTFLLLFISCISSANLNI
jgi:hypothetical protein